VELRVNGEFDSAEPGVAEYLRARHAGLDFTSDIKRLEDVEVVVVALDTRVGDDGAADVSEVERLIEAVADALPEDVPLVIMSQVSPGFTRRVLPRHENTYYQVETLVFGKGLERALKPERYIVGTCDPAEPLDPRFSRLLEMGGCPILPMPYESAELAKLAINFFLAASLTATNSLAELCSKLGADWAPIADALHLDRRIGRDAYLTPGLGIGGTNIVRDLVALQRAAALACVDGGLATTMLEHSLYSREWMIRSVHDATFEIPTERLAVLGLSYKPGTESTIGSAALDVIRVFGPSAVIRVHDPAALLPVWTRGYAEQVATVDEALVDASTCVIATPWDDYRDLCGILSTLPSLKTVIDPYRVLSATDSRLAHLNIRQLGIAPRPSSLTTQGA